MPVSRFPKEPKRIAERIRRFERELRRERKTFGFVSDSSGKRYLLGPLYLLLGDVAGAVRSFEWFDRTFPDDAGEPYHRLCWSLALYRSGDTVGASRRLLQAMLSNLYLVPHLLGMEQEDLGIWHSSNWGEKAYLQDAPVELLALWDRPALEWAKESYQSPKFRRVRSRYIEIFEQLEHAPVGPRRSQLVQEAHELRVSSI